MKNHLKFVDAEREQSHMNLQPFPFHPLVPEGYSAVNGQISSWCPREKYNSNPNRSAKKKSQSYDQSVPVTKMKTELKVCEIATLPKNNHGRRK
ncbi:hypothetical protein CDAR_549981 [Caerostris darwini]|uniref:Uncharacterized protein n=1 Tax=Caerostris darwini TaxID=1538125 RepID=A0AAV4VY86_9ARAC|nr:hypothetical protein CDAR_549981 [Caerostris darwini]